MTPVMPGVDYVVDGKTLSAFFHSDAFVRVLIGPFGSGKTVACAIELFPHWQAEVASLDEWNQEWYI